MSILPYGGKCPYDNTEVDCTDGYLGNVWFCQNGHEWLDYVDIAVPDRCEGSFKYGYQYDRYHSVCQWCGQMIEHYPFFHFYLANQMKYHEMTQPSTAALELGEWAHVSENTYLVGKECDGCLKVFEMGQIAEAVVDRFTRLGYVIHRGCWDRLVEAIEKRRV